MGFLRKVTFVATGGASGLVIKANSKKERTAKALEAQVRLQRQAMRSTSPTLSRPVTRPSQPRPALKAVRPSGPTVITFPIANYDGGAPVHPNARKAGTLKFDDQGHWEMGFKGTARYIYGALARYRMQFEATGLESCHVTMVDKQNSSVSWNFDLPTTSATTVQGKLTPVLDKLKTAAVPIPASPTHRPLHAARDPQGTSVPAISPPRAVTLPIGVADEIAKLGKLKESGLLTDNEFAAQKAKLLAT